jgi:hypothetical protein
LVFKEGTVRDIGNRTYEKVITQFGQQVYIPRSSIAGKFKDIYGNQEYIFHADEYMCPSEEPDCDEDTSIPISRGMWPKYSMRTVLAGQLCVFTNTLI